MSLAGPCIALGARSLRAATSLKGSATMNPSCPDLRSVLERCATNGSVTSGHSERLRPCFWPRRLCVPCQSWPSLDAFHHQDKVMDLPYASSRWKQYEPSKAVCSHCRFEHAGNARGGLYPSRGGTRYDRARTSSQCFQRLLHRLVYGDGRPERDECGAVEE